MRELDAPARLDSLQGQSFAPLPPRLLSPGVKSPHAQLSTRDWHTRRQRVPHPEWRRFLASMESPAPTSGSPPALSSSTSSLSSPTAPTLPGTSMRFLRLSSSAVAMRGRSTLRCTTRSEGRLGGRFCPSWGGRRIQRSASELLRSSRRTPTATRASQASTQRFRCAQGAAKALSRS